MGNNQGDLDEKFNNALALVERLERGLRNPQALTVVRALGERLVAVAEHATEIKQQRDALLDENNQMVGELTSVSGDFMAMVQSMVDWDTTDNEYVLELREAVKTDEITQAQVEALRQDFQERERWFDAVEAVTGDRMEAVALVESLFEDGVNNRELVGRIVATLRPSA